MFIMDNGETDLDGGKVNFGGKMVITIKAHGVKENQKGMGEWYIEMETCNKYK